MTTISELISEGEESLKASSPSARLDSTLLLSDILKISKVGLLTGAEREVSVEDAEKYREHIQRRKNFEPVAYIIGEKEFYGLTFLVTPDVLIPRPETELLVEEALKFVSGISGSLRILDLATGSGCIAISIANELKKAKREFNIIASDISREALIIAIENSKRLGVSDCIEFVQSDWFSSIEISKPFHCIVSNPPYIAVGDSRVSKETAFEPKSALYSGNDGLDALRVIVEGAPKFLESGGMLACEIGDGQGELALRLSSKWATTKECLRDLAGRERVVRWVK